METKILRVREVCARVGWSRTTIWRKTRDGEFPGPFDWALTPSAGWQPMYRSGLGRGHRREPAPERRWPCQRASGVGR